MQIKGNSWTGTFIKTAKVTGLTALFIVVPAAHAWAGVKWH